MIGKLWTFENVKIKYKKKLGLFSRGRWPKVICRFYRVNWKKTPKIICCMSCLHYFTHLSCFFKRQLVRDVVKINFVVRTIIFISLFYVTIPCSLKLRNTVYDRGAIKSIWLMLLVLIIVGREVRNPQCRRCVAK